MTNDMRYQTTPLLHLEQWCEYHEVPYRRVLTNDDRMVCWFSWWVEAMNGEPLQEPCIPGKRAILNVKQLVTESI